MQTKKLLRTRRIDPKSIAANVAAALFVIFACIVDRFHPFRRRSLTRLYAGWVTA
jgi:hypothetical protein